jgi:phosphomannomutase
MVDTMMRSVSGVRGIVGSDLTADLVSRYAAAFGELVATPDRGAVVLARDSRASGPMFAEAARDALCQGCGPGCAGLGWTSSTAG